MLFSIVTPSCGNNKLEKLLECINSQDLGDNNQIEIEHIIVVDGDKYSEKCKEIVNKVPPNKGINRYVVYLPFNTGANKFLGHKIYASFTQLVNGDWVFLFDDDNYFDNNHILSFYELIKSREKTDWLYSLRKIVNDNGYVCNDDCESLGYLRHVFYNSNEHLIDTNCYCIRTDIMIKLSPIWNRIGLNNVNDPDRLFGKYLMENCLDYDCTRKYTVNYYVGNRENSVKDTLFIYGNSIINKLYNDIPWNREILYIAYKDNNQTERFINNVNIINNIDILKDKYLISAFTKYIPNNITLFIFKNYLEEENPLEIDRLLNNNSIKKYIYLLNFV